MAIRQETGTIDNIYKLRDEQKNNMECDERTKNLQKDNKSSEKNIQQGNRKHKNKWTWKEE